MGCLFYGVVVGQTSYLSEEEFPSLPQASTSVRLDGPSQSQPDTIGHEVLLSPQHVTLTLEAIQYSTRPSSSALTYFPPIKVES